MQRAQIHFNLLDWFARLCGGEINSIHNLQCRRMIRCVHHHLSMANSQILANGSGQSCEIPTSCYHRHDNWIGCRFRRSALRRDLHVNPVGILRVQPAIVAL